MLAREHDPGRAGRADRRTRRPAGWRCWRWPASGCGPGSSARSRCCSPSRPRRSTPANKEQVLALVTGLGALVSVICNPLAGAFSDRTTLRAGRRLPWLVGGAARRGGSRSRCCRSRRHVVGDGARLVRRAGRAQRDARRGDRDDPRPGAGRPARPDRRHRRRRADHRRGRPGPASRRRPAASRPATSPSRRSCWCSRSRSRCRSRDLALPPEARPAVRRAPVPARRSGSRRARHPDFAWAWLTRFLVNLGNALGLLYLLYFLQDVIGYSSDEAEDRVFVLTAVYALHAGADHRRLRRLERPARAAQGVRDLVGAGRPASRGAAARRRPELAGRAGRGGRDGLRLRHLHRRRLRADHRGAARRAIDRAKDLGVINIANALPAGVRAGAGRRAPAGWSSRPAAWSRPDGDGFSVGYFALYLLAFLASVLGSVFVTRIRGVRLSRRGMLGPPVRVPDGS